MNDILMLKMVGYSVVMGNGEEEVKDFVEYVIFLNDEYGVVVVIYKMLEIND